MPSCLCPQAGSSLLFYFCICACCIYPVYEQKAPTVNPQSSVQMSDNLISAREGLTGAAGYSLELSWFSYAFTSTELTNASSSAGNLSSPSDCMLSSLMSQPASSIPATLLTLIAVLAGGVTLPNGLPEASAYPKTAAWANQHSAHAAAEEEGVSHGGWSAIRCDHGRGTGGLQMPCSVSRALPFSLTGIAELIGIDLCWTRSESEPVYLLVFAVSWIRRP